MPGKKKFPDLTGDGKVTKKDILKARGVPGFKEGGKVRGTKKKEKKEKELSIDPLKLANPKPKKEKPTISRSEPRRGKEMPMTPELIEKFKKREYPNPRAPKRDRNEIPKVKPMAKGGMVLEIGLRPASKQEMKMAKEMKPQKKAGGGMMKKSLKDSDAKALKGIEKQQESQARRAKEAAKAVKGYAREKARVRGTGSAISGKNFKGVF